MVVVRMVTGVLLAAHGLVHLLYLTDLREFSLDRSWLVPEGARRPVAVGLIAATVVGFVILALAVWGVPGLSAAWPVLTIVACLFSMVLLVLFWNTSLALGLAIDVVLIAVALVQPDWVARWFTHGG